MAPRPDLDPNEEDRYEEIVDGTTTWRVERSFLESNWTCIWGHGCLGIEPRADEASAFGCCSVGAELATVDEARLMSAMAAMIEPVRFQHHALVATDGIFSDETRTNTRVIDGACMFLNRVGFAGGEGCALHLAAQDAGESPIEWKPAVCWQLPMKVDWVPVDEAPSGREVATVRRWSRADWGEIGDSMAWCCTEGERAYVGDQRVIDSLGEELAEIVGPEVFVELQNRMHAGRGDQG